jgi:D-3-phosphoglycerate dehydrogenase
MKILANDGLDAAGRILLEAAGFEINAEKIAQDELTAKIAAYDVLVVRSATKVNAEILKASKLKLVARAGVGTDNIDGNCAKELGITVVNTPDAGSRSVAELVVAHLFSMARMLPLCNRRMPEHGTQEFNDLKKKASAGFELKGKKLGIVGFGRIGQELARMAIGLGMEVLVFDHKKRDFQLKLSFHPSFKLPECVVEIRSKKLNDVLKQADFISVHTPGSSEVLGEKEISQMKAGACLINCARGGVVNEEALLKALNSGHLAFAGLDVFIKEPPLDDRLLRHPNVSLSPHIGASTREGQERIGTELAERIIAHFKKQR